MDLFKILKISCVFLISTLIYAQEKSCTENFESINLECIKKHENYFLAAEKKELKRKEYLENAKNEKKGFNLKLAETQLDLVFGFDKEKLSETKNTIYLYQTQSGHYGKFLIKNILQTREECTLHIDSETYENQSKIAKTSTFNIKNTGSAWNVDRGSFDSNSGSNFLLRREHGLCVFKSINTKVFKLKQLAAPPEEEGNLVILYAGYFLIGLAIFLISKTVFQDEDRYKAQEKLEDAEQDDKKTTPNDIVLKYSRPFFKRYLSPVVQGMKKKKELREKYRRSLASSGMNKFLTPEDFFAFKLFLIIGFPIVFLILRVFLEEEWPLMYIPIISIIGFYYPDFWIKGKTSQRQTEALENMPFVVDMLALSVEAGLDFVAAMQKVIEKAPPSALVEEFEIMIKETKIGSSRAEALRQMSWRIDALPIASFCATLIAADSVGANISPILKTLAQELREKRSSLIEQRGAQAATKILIPMIFFVLPATLIIIMAPIVLQLLGAQ